MGIIKLFCLFYNLYKLNFNSYKRKYIFAGCQDGSI